MPLDPSIPLQAKTVENPFQQIQAPLQTAQGLLALKSSQMQLGANQAISDAYSKSLNPDGSVDFNKLQQLAGQNGAGAFLPNYMGQIAEQRNKQLAYDTGTFDLELKRLSQLRQTIGGVALDPNMGKTDMSETIASNIATLARNGLLPMDQAVREIQSIPGDPGMQKQWVNQHLFNTLSGEQQLSALQPSMQTINTGGSQYAVPFNKMTGQQQGPSTEFKNTLSPESAASRVPVYQGGVQGTASLGSITPGEPGYQGNNPFGSGRNGAQPGQNPSFVANAPATGTPEDIAAFKKDYQDIQAQAAQAQKIAGLSDNILQYADKAITNPTDKLVGANKWLAALGIPAAKDANEATALLEKNGAMIQSALGGNTDAARAVISHFSAGTAIPAAVNKEIASYMKGNAQMQQFQANYLRDASNGTDPALWKQKRAELSQVSDPRLWQFQNMSPADRTQYLAKMKSAQGMDAVNQFGSLYKKANALGAFQ